MVIADILMVSKFLAVIVGWGDHQTRLEIQTSSTYHFSDNRWPRFLQKARGQYQNGISSRVYCRLSASDLFRFITLETSRGHHCYYKHIRSRPWCLEMFLYSARRGHWQWRSGFRRRLTYWCQTMCIDRSFRCALGYKIPFCYLLHLRT